jgi:hypothetical protein
MCISESLFLGLSHILRERTDLLYHMSDVLDHSQYFYSSCHQIAFFKATERHPPPPCRSALSRQFSVASFAKLRVLNCLHSPGLHCSSCNIVRFFCDLGACNMVTATIEPTDRFSLKLIRIFRLQTAPQICTVCFPTISTMVMQMSEVGATLVQDASKIHGTTVMYCAQRRRKSM